MGIHTALQLDIMIPCSREEAILVLRNHDKYLKTFQRRRDLIYSAQLSIDEAIESSVMRRNLYSEASAGRKRYRKDAVYEAFAYAENLAADNKKQLIRSLEELNLEEQKFFSFMRALGTLPPMEQEFLLDRYYRKLSPEEIYRNYTGSEASSGALNIRKYLDNRAASIFRHLLEACDYKPPEKTV
ncbi:MAG: hypothetical protein K6E30_01145 [Lachnospiraceae bacterium]|nr:hypothetical protein [Lachnospiraceae bacterium]